MSNRTKSLPLVLLAGALVCATPLEAQKAAASPCLPAQPGTAEHLQYVRTLAADSTPSGEELRAGTAIPHVADTVNAVAMVTASRTCSKALAAYVTAARLEPNTVYRVEVLRVDSVLVVSNPTVMSGEHVQRYVFDARFKHLRTYLK